MSVGKIYSPNIVIDYYIGGLGNCHVRLIYSERFRRSDPGIISGYRKPLGITAGIGFVVGIGLIIRPTAGIRFLFAGAAA